MCGGESGDLITRSNAERSESEAAHAWRGCRCLTPYHAGMRHTVIEHALREGSHHDADAAAVALSAVGAVRLLIWVLQTVVGNVAACALYRRSVFLAKFSFLRALDDAKTHDELLAPLHLHLASRPVDEAQKESRALLNALVDLLDSMIGETLTQRLLTKAWGAAADHASASPEKFR